MDPNSILGQIMTQVGQPAAQEQPQFSPQFAPIQRMLSGARAGDSQIGPANTGHPQQFYSGERAYDAALERQRQLQQLAQQYGPPPAEAQSFEQQMAYYRQVIGQGARTGGGMRTGPR